MEFGAPRSFDSNRIAGALGCLLPSRPRRFRRTQRYLSDRRPLQARTRSFILPRAFRLLQSPRQPTCSSCDLAAAKERLPRGSVPHRGINRRRPLMPGDPTPQAHVPSAAFPTPSTVCSATCLAGLFHPAATSRVCPPGVCPSPRSRTGFPRPIHALVRFEASACGLTRASFRPADFRALLPAVSAVSKRGV
jgi:hypothetical protein